MSDAPTADSGPGFLAFLAFFILALALWFLMRNMNARMRRMSYRQQAAHRGKDDPQVAPGELVPEDDGPGVRATEGGDGGTASDPADGAADPADGAADQVAGGTDDDDVAGTDQKGNGAKQ